MSTPLCSPHAIVQRRTNSAEETRRLGMALGASLAPGTVVALQGDLGAGKTTLIQGMAAALGVRGRVTSPTFTLVNEYSAAAGVRVLHVDTYRLGGSADEALLEAAAFGLEELLDDPHSIVFIEWAERVRGLLPADHLLISLAYAEEEEARSIHCRAYGEQSAKAIERFIAQEGTMSEG